MEQPLQAALSRAHELAWNRVLWPGYRLDEIPIILYFKERAYLVGHPAPPPGYASAGEVVGRAVFVGPALPAMAGNTATEVAGHLSAVVQIPEAGLDSVPEGDGIDGYTRLILHEGFHVFQARAHGTMDRLDAAAMQVMARYPESDPTNNAMAILENRLLVAALEGDNEAVGRFLAMRLHRHKRLARLGQEDLVRYEQAAEYVEGTPTYVEVRAGRPLAELADRLLACNHGGKWAAYRPFYETGAAQALLLDRLAPGWQGRLVAGGATLQELLLDAVGGDLPPVSQVVAEMGFAAILAEEERREAERRERIAALLRELEEGDGIRVEVVLPPAVQGVMWDPTNLLNLEPGRRLHTRFCGAVGPEGLRVQIERLCLEEWGADGRRFHLRLPSRPELQADPTGRFRASGVGLTIDAPAGALEETDQGVRIALSITVRPTPP